MNAAAAVLHVEPCILLKRKKNRLIVLETEYYSQQPLGHATVSQGLSDIEKPRLTVAVVGEKKGC